MKSAGLNDHNSTLRQLFDSLTCLAIAVTLFRTFEVEGYIITTGSMAPILLGHHKRVTCPDCRFSFAFGNPGGSVDADRESAVCPNCGRRAIEVASVPRNDGDQLLVHKNAFSVVSPRRWEVAVFHNPNNPEQAYVKRIVGLPHERVRIVKGDIYVNGEIQRKNFDQQKVLRIPVYDHDFRPVDSAEWQPRWRPEQGWEEAGSGFEAPLIGRTTGDKRPSVAWVKYRHWIRSGGTHVTSLPLKRVPEGVSISGSESVTYDTESSRLMCRGVLDPDARDRLLKMTGEAEFREALGTLEQQSHFASITDGYGYNRSRGVSATTVRDLMLSIHLTIREGDGQFLIRMIDGFHVFDCVLDVGLKQARLHIDGDMEPVHTGSLGIELAHRPVLVEMSLMDRQVVLALDNEAVLQFSFDESWTATDTGERYSMKGPVQFGLHALAARVDSLRLFRDVYYTSENGQHGVSEDFQLGADEYFALGDNSPVSIDSRSWAKAAVNAQMLLGKPFLVHLPSRPGKFKIGNYVGHIRIPDVSRIRYIH